jgi:hypothetical protein
MPQLVSDREATPAAARVLIDKNDARAAVLIHQKAPLKGFSFEIGDLLNV